MSIKNFLVKRFTIFGAKGNKAKLTMIYFYLSNFETKYYLALHRILQFLIKIYQRYLAWYRSVWTYGAEYDLCVRGRSCARTKQALTFPHYLPGEM